MIPDIESLVQEWQQHHATMEVQLSSASNAGNRCDAYRRLIAHGSAVLPYLRDHWDDPAIEPHLRAFGFTQLLFDITKQGVPLPEELRGRFVEMHTYLGKWLKEQK